MRRFQTFFHVSRAGSAKKPSVTNHVHVCSCICFSAGSIASCLLSLADVSGFAGIVESAVFPCFLFFRVFALSVAFALALFLALVKGLEEDLLFGVCCLHFVLILEELDDLVSELFDDFPLSLPLVLGGEIWARCPPNKFLLIWLQWIGVWKGKGTSSFQWPC